MKRSNRWTLFSALLLLFIFAFGVGTLAASITLKGRPQEAVQASANGNWGLSFQTEGKTPVANATAVDHRKTRLQNGHRTGNII